MRLTNMQRRALKIIDRHVIHASTVYERDAVIDPSTGKRAVPEQTLDFFLDEGLVEWKWDEDRGENMLRITEKGREVLSSEQ